MTGISKTTDNGSKEETRGFLRMLLVPLGASLLGNMLTEKGILGAGYGFKDCQSKEREGALRSCYGNKKKLNSSFPLRNIEMQKHYLIKSRFNGVYSRDNLPKK